MNLLLLFLFGVFIGVLSGLMGIGGGIVLVPGLMLLFGFSQPEAQGTSLAVLIPPVGIFAAFAYYEHGFVRIPVVAWIAAGFLVGAYFGAKLVPLAPPAALRVAFGALLLYLGFNFVFTPTTPRPMAALPSGVATVASLLLSRLRRTPPPSRPRPLAPGDDIEYRI